MQQQLLERIAATGKPVVLVLLSGSPLAVPWAAEKLPAIAAGTGEVERVSWIVVAYLIAATIAAPSISGIMKSEMTRSGTPSAAIAFNAS